MDRLSIKIVSAKRTPIGKYLQSLRKVSAVELGTMSINATLAEVGVAPDELDSYIMGNVLKAGLGQNPARLAALKAGIPPEIGGFTVDQVCASSLKAVILGGQKILSGEQNIVLAGGMESMSRARITFPPSVKWGIRFNPVTPEAFHTENLVVKDGLWDPATQEVMGLEADKTAKKYGVTRKESDKFAYESHMKAAKAAKNGGFKGEIVPVTQDGEPILKEDEGIRYNTNMDTLSKLPPVFVEEGMITAGSASQLSDGASAVLLMSEEKRKELGIESMGEVVDWDTTFIDPEEFIRAPIPSVKSLLKKNNMDLEDIDVWEHNEAFACASVLVRNSLGIDPSKFNMRGGAVALGHPIGCSGTRILTTLLHIMKDKEKSTGIATICHGGGGAVSLLVKRK